MSFRNTRELEKGLSARRRQKIATRVKEMEMEMLLSELRRQSDMSQHELAKAMGIKQPNISKLESGDDMQISTLRRLVAALGGKLRVSVQIPGKGEFLLSQFDQAKD
jgi:transcriptional regulator with XRE-family HTH domain